LFPNSLWCQRILSTNCAGTTSRPYSAHPTLPLPNKTPNPLYEQQQTTKSQPNPIQPIRIHLHNRPLILLPCPQDIIQHRKKHDRPRHQDAKIHIHRLHRRRHGPEAEEEDDAAEGERVQVDRDAEDAGQVKGAPDELARFASGVVEGGFVRGAGANAAGEAAVEQEGFGDDVGCVEAADGEGDDVVEGGGGAEVDEADEAGDAGGDDDGVDGDGAAGLDLLLSPVVGGS